jgi:hypothetical protein
LPRRKSRITVNPRHCPARLPHIRDRDSGQRNDMPSARSVPAAGTGTGLPSTRKVTLSTVIDGSNQLPHVGPPAYVRELCTRRPSELIHNRT